MVRALDGPVPSPEAPVSKVLPEAKTDVYRLAGEWLRAHTPPEALIGVTEVGVMGYYADRPMVDFLGILQPEVSRALARGDLYWALLYYQPDYLALTAVAPLYGYDLHADPLFQAAYAPIQRFEDPRFWGSPLTVYRRQVARVPPADGSAALPAGILRLDVDLGSIRLLGAALGEGPLLPGDIASLTLYWQALGPIPRDYTVFVHLLGQHDRVLAQRDAAPGLGARPTGEWAPGQVVADPYLIALPEAAYAPDQAVWEVGLYDAATGQRLATQDGRDNVRFGSIAILPLGTSLSLDFGAIRLVGYDLDRLALSPGEALSVTLHWQGSAAAAVTAQLVAETGDVAARSEGFVSPAGQGTWTDPHRLAVGGASQAGACDLEILVSDPATGRRLPLFGADGLPKDDRARLTKVRLYP